MTLVPDSTRPQPDALGRLPYWPGNTESLRSGAFSPRVYEPVVQALLEEALASEAYLAEPRYRSSVERWASAEAKCLLIERWLDKVGPLDDEGNERPALRSLLSWQKRASEEAQQLGLTPLSRSKLGKNVTQTALNVAEIWNSTPAKGREEDGR